MHLSWEWENALPIYDNMISDREEKLKNYRQKILCQNCSPPKEPRVTQALPRGPVELIPSSH
jgi:hypothetical protein